MKGYIKNTSTRWYTREVRRSCALIDPGYMSVQNGKWMCGEGMAMRAVTGGHDRDKASKPEIQ